MRKTNIQIPVLPLRDVVVFPSMVMPLFVGREKSIKSLEASMQQDKKILLVAQRNAELEEPTIDDLYEIGTIAHIIQMLRLPDGTIKLLVEGESRATILQYADTEDDSYLQAQIKPLIDKVSRSKDLTVIQKSAIEEFEAYSKLNKKISPEVINALSNITDPSQLSDTIASHMPIELKHKQHLLENLDVLKRLEYLLGLMESEIDLIQVEKRIRSRVKEQMEKSQRDYYLNEQIKALQKELGDDENGFNDYQQLEESIRNAKMTAEAETKTLAELKKLKMMSPMSAEATVIRSYIDWMIQVPWHAKSKLKNKLMQAEEILNTEHYGLERIKERILEYLAVQSRLKSVRGPILCLVGPPGVGKTSLGQSIAHATGRTYVRMALGGVRDEAEIRGHRKTYIGSLPGQIIQKMVKAKVKNPLFLLDEIDKMASDYRGDPASALLEVLDPEQNNTFNDNYLEVDYDLSEVMFMATANSLDIPIPLLDRMEIIRIAGYTEDEKLNISKQHLLKKQFERNGIKEGELIIDDSAIVDIIRYYTREAGVRNLERTIAKLCRKTVKQLISKPKLKTVHISDTNLAEFLGPRTYDYGRAEKNNAIGEVTGLAWTQVGGELLTIEATSVVGKGKLMYTGSLGDVMQESIKTALTVVRANAEKLGINSDFYENRDIHVHVPEGATPKDGPSAGIGMCTALVSSLTGNPVKAEVAMTGEITLHGKVLPIGGLKEKLLAAHRGGIKTVIIPKDNVKDLEDIPDNIKKALTIYPVENIEQVLLIALEHPPMGIEVLQPKKLAISKQRKKLNLN